ncbi:hypothetical protein NW765_005518 [Fusarium oxysporum]|nr:hypothetical protein NW765_005518 [Fusarium oxysporum]KAJ4266828.1 hypothetical protein NW764_015185 [Fusarium oxysporum]
MNYIEYIANPHRQCAIVAHRGLWNEAPENSLLSIRRAMEAGYNVVEIDVRRAADGEFVLLHDSTLNRIAGIDKKPEELTLEELISLSLRNRDGGPNNPFTKEKVPTVRDVFELTRNKIFIHLDIKHRHVIPEVLDYAQKMAWIKANITTHNVPLIARTHLEHDDWREQANLALDLKPLICEASFRDLSQVDAMKQQFHDAGITLWVNTLDSVASPGFTESAALEDPDKVWGRLLRAGFSAIQTDEMAALRSFLPALD